MRLNDNIYVLKIPSIINSGEFIYPTLISNNNKLLLIDTGFPGQLEEIKKAIEDEGFKFDNLEAVVLTHQDIDHVGSIKKIIDELSHVKVLSSAGEAEYINGSKTPTKVAYLENNLNNLPHEAKIMYEKFKSFYECNKVNIDVTLKEGDSVNGFDNLTVIDTPGHTPGHISLYANDSKTLIAGDAFIVKDDEICLTDAELNFDEASSIILQKINRRNSNSERQLPFCSVSVYIKFFNHIIKIK